MSLTINMQDCQLLVNFDVQGNQRDSTRTPASSHGVMDGTKLHSQESFSIRGIRTLFQSGKLPFRDCPGIDKGRYEVNALNSELPRSRM
jgi:hypothetical protein